MQNEFAQFAFAQFAHFCSFLQGKNIITTYVSMYYKAHPCFASKLSKSKLSKIEQIEQKSVFVPGENEVTEMGKRLVYCKAVNPMQAAYPDDVVAKSHRACSGGRTEKKQ